MLDLTKPWRSYPILSVDFEASSADPLTCEPVEVACVRYEDRKVVGRFSSLLRTVNPIPADSIAIHGITDEMTAGMPSLEEVGPDLLKLADGAVPMAFQASYDRTIMHRYLGGEGVPLFDPAHAWLCSSAMAWKSDRYEPGSGRMKLTACCERRGIRIDGAHRAMADALASGELFHQLTAATPDNVTMASLLAGVAKVQAERDADWAKFQKRIREEERVIWRGYAQAALSGLLASPASKKHSEDVEDAAFLADRMLEVERARWL